MAACVGYLGQLLVPTRLTSPYGHRRAQDRHPSSLPSRWPGIQGAVIPPASALRRRKALADAAEVLSPNGTVPFVFAQMPQPFWLRRVGCSR